MTKREFLNRLKEALENGLDSRAVQENMDYYRSYIEEEAGGGRSEEEVIEDLGDPWVIAQSVINMAENRSAAEGGYGAGDMHDDGRTGDADGQSYSNTQMEEASVPVGNYWDCVDRICGDRRFDIAGYAGAASGDGGYYGDETGQADAVRRQKRQPVGI